MSEQDDSVNGHDSAPAAPEPANDDALAAAEARAAEAERQAGELKERLLRALAEAENVRRRAEREAEDARKYAVG
jgi:molecular chaperone GrpE